MKTMETSERGIRRIPTICVEHSKQLKCLVVKAVEAKKDLDWIKKQFDNHLAHHWAVTIAVAVSALGTITTLILYILKVK